MHSKLRILAGSLCALVALILLAGGACQHTRQVRMSFKDLPDAFPGQLPGASFTITVKVTNTGNKGSGGYLVEAWLSSDSTLDTGSDALIGTSAGQPGVGKGGVATVSFSATVPALYPSGEWFIFLRIPGVTTGFVVFPVLISGSTPDFTVEGLGLSSSTIQRGTAVQVDWNIANLGGGTGTVKNGFFLSLDDLFDGGDTYLGMDVAPNYTPGSSVQKTSLVTLPGNQAVGLYYFLLVANYDLAVTEVDNFNNAIALPIFVNTHTGVDYVMGNNNVGDTLVVGQGTTLAVSHPAANAGTLNATSTVEIGAYLMSGPFVASTGGILVGASSVGPLNAGQSQTVSFNVIIPPTLPSGDYYLGFVIDDLNFEIESNETNNGTPTTLIHVSADDSFENNDAQANAKAIAKGTLYSGLMSLLNDDDWFRVTVGGFTNQMTATVTNTTPGDVSVAIYNGAGTLIGAGSVTGTGWAGTLTQLPPGNYYFRVQHLTADFTTTYNFRVDSIEEPAVVLGISGNLSCDESLGNADTYNVHLSRAPKAGETVTVTLGFNAAQITPAPTVLNFTAANYTVDQVVSVTAVNDGTPETGQQFTITHTVTTDDGTSDYNSATAGNVLVDVTD